MKNNPATLFTLMVRSNEGANWTIYERLEIGVWQSCWSEDERCARVEKLSQATRERLSNNHLNGNVPSERLSRSKTLKFHDDIARQTFANTCGNLGHERTIVGAAFCGRPCVESKICIRHRGAHGGPPLQSFVQFVNETVVATPATAPDSVRNVSSSRSESWTSSVTSARPAFDCRHND